MEKVLLYYAYTTIKDPEDLKRKQTALCKRLDIKGRILIGSEGINGTVSGTEQSVSEYMTNTEKYPGLDSIDWKISDSEVPTFPRLRVVVRDEIVSLGLIKKGNDVSIENKADYIEPAELLELYEQDQEFVIIDARNEYESRIGKFKDAIVPNIDNFRDFPEFVDTIKHLKDKPVVTYCTGGVRCEKASAYLIEQGFNNVRQLHGGIHEYGNNVGGKHFEGSMYVFDNRLHVPVNNVNPTVVSYCHHCQTPSTRYINCCNVLCNDQIICCEKCDEIFNGGCSIECQANSRFTLQN